MTISQLFDQLEAKIIAAYEGGITMEEAEKLAGEFLAVQLRLSEELRQTELNARMRKNGVKALKAKIYLDAVNSSEKKPTEAALTAMIDSNSLVQEAQSGLDNAEIEAADLLRRFNTFKDAHVFYRQISKGSL